MAKKKANNFQDIHVEDYLAEYECNYITSETLIYDFQRRTPESKSFSKNWRC